QLIVESGTDRPLASLLPVEPKKYAIHQTILFFQSAGTPVHIDGWGLDTLPRGGVITLWIPLEPVDLDNGPIAIVPWELGRRLTQEQLKIRHDCSHEE